MLLRIRPYIHIVVLCLCWYIISSLGSQVTKKILTVCSLPLFLGEFQFIYTAFLAVLSCHLAYYCPKFRKTFPKGTFPEYKTDNHKYSLQDIITKPSKHIFQTVLPLGLFQFVGKYFGHTATSLVPVSTVASIKTLSPVFILFIQKLLKISTLKLDRILALSLSSLVFGVWIIVNEDSKSRGKSSTVEYSTYGVICAILSMLIFVGQNIYGKKVFTFQSSAATRFQKLHGLHREDSPLPIYASKSDNSTQKLTKEVKYDKLTLMIYISTVGFLLSFCWFMTIEFPILLNYVIYDIPSDKIKYIPWKLFLLNGTFHFLQAMIAFHLLGEISTLTYSIANLMKRIAIISVSWVFIGRPVTFLQIFGLLINVCGLFLYERCSAQNNIIKKRPE